VDIILGALLTAGTDQFRSAKKLGRGYRQTGDLDADELWEYMEPFVANGRRFPGLQLVVLHDGLPDELIESRSGPGLRFEWIEASTRHGNYERRHLAFRDYLDAHPEIGRLWLIDVNDVAFGTHPFRWLDGWPADRPAVGEEWNTYATTEWFTAAAPHLDPDSRRLLADHGDRYPLNCGAWGGTRAVCLEVLRTFGANIERSRDYLDANPPPHPLVTDMWAFGLALIDRPVTAFKMDSGTVLAGVSSPLVHDRACALDLGRREELVSLRATLRHTQRLPGWCWDDKAEAMLQLVIDTRPALCAEIGVFGGRSLLAQAVGLRRNGSGVIYGIDPWTRAPSLEGYQFGPDTAAQAWTEETLTDVYAGLLAATVALDLSPFVRFLCAPSQLVAAAFEPASIDILHIDGNHSEDAAVRDVRYYLPLVRDRGWVWVDDTNWDSVRPALDLIEQTCRLVKDYERFRLYRLR
jgi:hypothetical protein